MTIHRDKLPADAYQLRMSQLVRSNAWIQGCKTLYEKKQSKYACRKVHGGRTTYDIIELDGKVVIPIQLYNQIVKWYHDTLMHPGITRLLK